MSEPSFTYWECPDCGFDAVTADAVTKDWKRTPICPLCAGDNGRDVPMRSRPATPEDKDIEGNDARRAT